MLHFVLEWITNYSVFGRLFTTCWYFLLAYFMFADMLVTVLVTLNRFIAVIFKHQDSVRIILIYNLLYTREARVTLRCSLGGPKMPMGVQKVPPV